MDTSGRKSKSKKSSMAKPSDKSIKLNVSKSLPGEEEIREKAMEIYHQRIERGEYGNAETDWLEAERVLMDE